jgi:hypothetical protein
MDPSSSLLDSLNQAASTRNPSAKDVLALQRATTAPSELVNPERTTYAPSELVAPEHTTYAPSDVISHRDSMVELARSIAT